MEGQKPAPPGREFVDLLVAGRKIQAIKLYCETTGAGLKEGKEAVEHLQKELAATQPESAPKRAGCGAATALILVGTLGIAVLLIERMAG